MLGSAMRRLRVKYSARNHADAATKAPPSAVWIDAPIQPTATSRMTAAMLTKISLKPVMRRNDSSSAPGAARTDAICDRKAIAASGVSTFASTAACRSLSLYIGVVLFVRRSEEHTSELQSLMRISYAVFCLKKKKLTNKKKI